MSVQHSYGFKIPITRHFAKRLGFSRRFLVIPQIYFILCQRIGAAGIEKVFAASIVIHGDKTQEDEVCINTAVQEKVIAFLVDAKLCRKIIVHYLKIAKANKEM